MKYAEDITNFTIAEIAFFLLFVILIGYAILSDERTELMTEPIITKEEMSAKNDQLDRQNTEITDLRVKLKKYQDMDKSLRSIAEPSCLETGYFKGYLFTTIILDRDTYMIDNADYSWADIRKKYGPDINNASVNGCRHRIKVSVVANITAAEFDEALKKLESEFFILRIRPTER